MGPFNIKIVFEDRETTLTVLPDKKGQYTILYFGGVIGAVQFNNKSKIWLWIPADQLLPGNLPLYKWDKNGADPAFIAGENVVAEIGREIEYQVNP